MSELGVLEGASQPHRRLDKHLDLWYAIEQLRRGCLHILGCDRGGQRGICTRCGVYHPAIAGVEQSEKRAESILRRAILKAQEYDSAQKARGQRRLRWLDH